MTLKHSKKFLKKRGGMLAALCSIALMPFNSVPAAHAEYTWETETHNNWRVVQDSQVYNGDVLLGVAWVYQVPEPAAISPQKGEVTTFSSPGTITVIGRTNPAPISDTTWLFGLYNYSSTSSHTLAQTTKATYDAKMVVDIETREKQGPEDDFLAVGVDVVAHQSANAGQPGAGAVTEVTFKRDLDVKMVNQTTNVSGASNLFTNAVAGISLRSVRGGRFDAAFGGSVTIGATATAAGRHVYGIYSGSSGANGVGDKIVFNGAVNVTASAIKDGRVWGLYSAAGNGSINTITTSEKAPITINATKSGGGQYVQAFVLSSGAGGKQTANLGAKLDTTAISDVNTPVYAASLDAKGANSQTDLNVAGIDFKAASAFGTAYGMSNSAASGGSVKAVVGGDTKISVESSNGVSYALSTAANDANSRVDLTFEKAVEISAQSETKTAYGVFQRAITGSRATTTFAGPATVSLGEGGFTAAYVSSDGQGSISVLDFKGDATLNAVNPTRFGWAVQSRGNGAQVLMGAGEGKKVSVFGHLYSTAGGKIDAGFKTADSNFTGASSLGDENNRGTTNLHFAGGGTWNMVDGSFVTSLTMGSGGVVNYGAAGTNFENRDDYLTLSTKGLYGTDGLFKMRGDVEAQKGDLLDITVTSEGAHRILYANNPQATASATTALQLVRSGIPTVAAFNATFKLANPNEVVSIPQTPGANVPGAVVELGGFLYQLGRPSQSKVVSIADTNENNWYLFPAEKAVTPEPEPPTPPAPPAPPTPPKPRPTPAADVGINFVGLNWILAREELTTLTQRMGDLRNEPLQDGEASDGDGWVRYRRSKYALDETDQLSAVDVDTWGAMIGRDWRYNRPDGSSTWWGLFGGLSRSDVNIAALKGVGRIKGSHLGLYGTWQNPKGFYVDAVLKYGWYRGNYSVNDAAGKPVHADGVNTQGLGASLEVGQRFYKDTDNRQGWYLEPQAQLSYTHLRGLDFVTGAGLRVDSDDFSSLIGRVGFHLGFDAMKREKNPWNGYVKVMYEYELLGDGTVRLNGTPVSQDFSGGWLVYGLGAMFRDVKRDLQGYLEVQRTTGGRVEQQWQINAGLRFEL